MSDEVPAPVVLVLVFLAVLISCFVGAQSGRDEMCRQTCTSRGWDGGESVGKWRDDGIPHCACIDIANEAP